MVSTCSLISKSSSPFTTLLGIVTRSPTTICITIMFCNFCSYLTRSKFLSFFSFFYFPSVVCRDDKVPDLANSFFLLHILLVHMVRLKCFAQFPVDHFFHQVVSSLILFFMLICYICLLYD